MARIEVTTHIEAPVEDVWAVLADLERQAEWMVDAESVTVLSPHREGADVTIRCRTRILGMVVNDDLVVTEWQPPTRLGMRHLGALIRGVGAFELEPTFAGTKLLWWEEIDAPFGPVGEFAADAVAPLVERVFRRSLAGLKRICEPVPARP